ncbi:MULTISPECIES: NrtR DNA-binding winged helix domain-containing protein [unclassified Rhodococcus (in: high G+C Gram-positive bacteria)]|uniref:NUDIX hydrolase n=1 Tax=Rhodococcus sp. SJ-3 TaxID=3454628 RepID=UPI002D87B0C8|nr:NUDIX hydrolase [Rhodococcus sp. (in: high G+C Gram-positive bacteria)]
MSTNPGTPSKPLTDYPRPSVAVDVAVLTVVDETLKVLVVDHPRGRALPGTFLHPGERLADAAHRALHDKARLGSVEFHQMAMLDDPARDDRGWVLSMAHSAAVPFERFPTGAQLVPVDDASGLAFDHSEVVGLAVDDLRRRYATAVDPSGLIGDEFTILELRRLYEVIYGRRFPKDTFRRHLSHGVDATGEFSREGAGRPAELYRRTGEPLPPSAASFLANRSV